MCIFNLKKFEWTYLHYCLTSQKMNTQPTLLGSIIDLKPLGTEDFEEMYLSASDPLVWEQHPAFNRYQRPVFDEFLKLAMESKGAFKILNKETQKIIGSSRFYDFDPLEKSTIVGYTFLERKYWGKGFNEELKQLMLDYAFQFVETVYFEVGSKNTRSQLAMKKIGARFYKNRELDGNSHFVYRIDKKDWILD